MVKALLNLDTRVAAIERNVVVCGRRIPRICMRASWEPTDGMVGDSSIEFLGVVTCDCDSSMLSP